MARVAAEARGEKRDWSLVFKCGWTRKLRVEGFFAGHVTKEELKEELLAQQKLLEEKGRNEGNGPNLQKYLDAESVADAGKETGRKKKKHGSRSRSNDGGPDPGSDHQSGRRREGSKNQCKELSSNKVRDVVLASNWDLELRGSTAPIFPPAEEKRRLSAHDDSLLPVIPTPERAILLPVVSVPNFMPHMDEGSESSLDNPAITSDVVDNFIIHANSRLMSFTMLPVRIDGKLSGGAGCPKEVFLIGTTGPECATFKRRVKMWKLMLHPTQQPRFLLKTNKGDWVTIRKPNSNYVKFMSDATALAHFLNFVKKHPHASTKAAENYLQKKCSGRMDGEKPPLDRLSQHLKVIRSYVEKDEDIKRATVLRNIFPNLFVKTTLSQRNEEGPLLDAVETAGTRQTGGPLPLKGEIAERKEKRYKVKAKKPKFLTASAYEPHSDSDSDYAGKKKQKQVQNGKQTNIGSERPHRDAEMGCHPDGGPKPRSKNEQHKFTQAELNTEDPPICVICDDGGDLIYCEGPCQRHFHPTIGSGAHSFCETLGLRSSEVKVMGKYFCDNCKHKQQQCFICGELGSSVRTANGPQEVRRCDITFCTRFYHAECAAEMLSEPGTKWEHLAAHILDGTKKLFCPRHCCSVCGEAEVKEPGMLVQCRRCPKAWHRACLTNFSRSGELDTTPIWNHHYREFIYCRNHEIVGEFQTPMRNHVRFPAI